MRRWAQVNGMREGGIALLVFVIVLALAAIAYALSDVSIVQVRYAEKLKTQTALKQAKRALLDYALTYEDAHPGEYGFLPCPDTGGSPIIPPGEELIPEGGSHGTCGLKQVNTIGLFPWASLETGILKSGTNNCFWYAVSGEYKSAATTKPDMLNEDTNGSIRVYDADGNLKQGALAQDRVIAIVIDPSNALPGQNRTYDEKSLCGKDYPTIGEYYSAEYLEGNGVINNSDLSGGALDIDDFISKSAGSDTLDPPFNDQLVTITRDELWGAILSRKDFIEDSDSAIRRLTEALAKCIAEYGNASVNKKLPRPAFVDFGGADYREDANYNDTATTSFLGRYPHTVDDSDIALGALKAPNEGEKILFNKGFCDAIPVVGGPPDINLNTASGAEGYTMWKNWKDHFFYAVSAYYAPSSADDTPGANCDGNNCIVVGGNQYAAVVLFAGSRSGAKVRNEPEAGDTDTKKFLTNYLEVTNSVDNGTGDYTPTGATGTPSRDIAYCITDEDSLMVVSCP